MWVIQAGRAKKKKKNKRRVALPNLPHRYHFV